MDCPFQALIRPEFQEGKTMRRRLSILRFLVVESGAALFVLGLLFWNGRALNLVPVHMMLVGVLVLCLWVIAAIGLRSGIPTGFVSLVLLWSLIMPLLGVLQNSLVPGSWHWTVPVVHLLVGIAAIGLGQGMLRRIAVARQGGMT